MNRYFVEFFIKNKRFILLAVIESVLFISYFYIVSPSNFGSFSVTLRYYISALGTLLAVVVSFNTFALQNQLKNLPRNLSMVEEQIGEIRDLLKPVLQKVDDTKFYTENKKESEKTAFDNATVNLTDAVRTMVILVRDAAKSILDKKEQKDNPGNNTFTPDVVADIASRVYNECKGNLKLFEKTQHLFSLITISTAEPIQRLRFNTSVADDSRINDFYQVLARLHVLKSTSISIFIRNTLADLSKELLIATIPVITFVGMISSISNYENYSILLIRILFAISISIVSIPFVLLFMKAMPILYLIKKTSTIPFSRQ